MLDFTKDVALAAGKVEVEAVVDTFVSIYVPNKDSVMIKLPKGKKITVTTLSAGETFMYLVQNSKDLKVSLAAGE